MLRRPEPTVAISVAVSPRPLYPGDTVDAEVVVTPRASLVAAVGLLRLSQTELLRLDSARDTLPQLSPARRRGRPRGSGLNHIDHVFAQELPMEGGIAHHYPAQLRLPAQAMPTVKGKHARITWQLSASVHTRADWLPGGAGMLGQLARARAGHCTQELVIFARPDAAAVGGAELPAHPHNTREHRNVHLRLELDTGLVSNGGTVAGTLSVQPQASFRAREMRVELLRWERSGSKQARIIEASEVLQRPAVLLAGEATDWAFRLQAPQRLMPSVLGQHTFVGWQVRAVVARRMLPNLTVAQLLQVYTSP